MSNIEDELVGEVEDAGASLAGGSGLPPEGEDGGEGEHFRH